MGGETGDIRVGNFDVALPGEQAEVMRGVQSQFPWARGRMFRDDPPV